MGIGEDIKLYLEEQGIAGTVTVAYEPPDVAPRRLTIVTGYGGLPPIENHSGADARTDQPRFQVETRDADPRLAELAANWAQNRLLRLVNRFVGDVFYQKVSSVDGPPKFLRRDTQRRVVYVASYEVQKAAPSFPAGEELDLEEAAS